MTPILARSGNTARPVRSPWLPWALLAVSLILVSYSIDSFIRLPQLLAISQQCRMSRMRPAYVDHSANLESFSPSGLWRKYRLYLYRERDFEPMELPTGSPALFVPGNAGSYGQVRSVASSASRQFYKENGSGARRDEWKDAPAGITHTDWYTIDFNEDFSAFSGSTLIEQATFINEVIAYLSDRYASPATRSFTAGERNTTVPILAHSMGGIAARLTAHLPNYPQGSVDTIVTLSSPHAYPPVPFDRSIEHVYSLINQPVTISEPVSPKDVPPLLISIAGGLLDTQLPSDPSSLSLARIGESVAPSRISTFTNSLPSLWSSVDHLAVMWCDQLREKIARGFLLDMMAFGRVSEERNTGGVSGSKSMLRRRRELWRRALSLFDVSDAGNGEMGPIELISSTDSLYDEDRETFVMEGESPTIQRATSGPDSALSMDQANSVFRVPAKLGEDDQDSHAFELITNLCVGWNPSSGMGAPIPQPIELVVQMCSNSPDSSNPVGGHKTSCQLVMPWQWELIPPSLLPRTDVLMGAAASQFEPNLPENKPFPDAEEIYHVPGLAFQRLRLDATLLKRQRVDWIRVERKTETGMFVRQRGLKSFVRAGWIRQAAGHVEKHGSSLLLTATQESAVQQHHQDYGLATTGSTPIATEWILKGVGSSLLARRVEIVPSQCLLENLAIYTLHSNDDTQHSTDPSFSPFLHISNRATGDSRWYPQLITPSMVRQIRDKTYRGAALSFPLSLHGNAPFMPPARSSVDEVRVQLWSDQALLRPVHGKSLTCKSPLESIRLSVDWKASAGLILLRYRFFLAAWPLGLLCICIGLSWFAWATNPDIDTFPALLTSILKPAFRTPLLGNRIDPLLGLLGCLIGTILIIDNTRLALYQAMPLAQSHGPSSPLLGMVLGLSDVSFSAGLVPCFLVVSYAALLVIVVVIHLSFRAVAATVTRFGLGRKLNWVGAATASSEPFRWNRSSLAGLAMLLLSVVLVVPHQFVFLCIFLLQMLNTLRAQLELRSASAVKQTHESRFNQHFSIFVVLVLLLPQKASFLVTWVRNLTSVGITTPKTIAAWMDHNVLDVAPIVVLVWLLAGGRMLEPPRSRLEAKAIVLGFAAVAGYAFLWGIRYTYRTYDAFNVLCMLLAFCQWRARRGGISRHARGKEAPHAAKVSSETLSMLGEQAPSDYRESKVDDAAFGFGEDAEAYELQPAIGSGGQLPIYHLALPTTIAAESEAASKSDVIAVNSDNGAKTAKDSPANDKLDDLIAEYLEVLDRYQQLRSATSDLFSRGYLKLSRAKMEYGASRLSSNSYDSRLLAEVRAAVVNEEHQSSGLADSPTISARRVKPDYSHLSEDVGVLIDTGETTGLQIGGVEDNTAKGLRRRTGPGSLSEPADRHKSLPSSSVTDPNLRSSPLGQTPKDFAASSVGSVNSATQSWHAKKRGAETSSSDDNDLHTELPKGSKRPVAMPDALLQFGGLPSISLRGAQTELKRALDQTLGVTAQPGEYADAGVGLVQLAWRLDRLSKAISQLRSETAASQRLLG